MKPMKKKILYISLLAICLSLLAGVTLAYYTTTATAGNVITTGDVKVQVIEQQLVNGRLQSFSGQSVPVMPSTEVSRIVSLRCLEQAAWVRMAYKVTVYDGEGTEMTVPAEELAAAIVISPDTESWTFTDGWWYYGSALTAGSTSTPLFDKIVFSGTNMDNKYQGCTVTVEITAQAVQFANNGSSVTEAQGWPEG